MNEEQWRAAVQYLKVAMDGIDAATAQVQHAIDVLLGMDGEGAKPEMRVVFASPVTGKADEVWGGDWFDATGFCAYYTAAAGGQAYHTGSDLNRPNYADSGATVYAAADGLVVFAGALTGWQGQVVCVRHPLEDGSFIWTRYAHIVAYVARGDVVKRGTAIGKVDDYNRDGAKGDHLHYDVGKIDLGLNPGDWPGMDKDRVARDYVDPAEWHRGRAAQG